MNKLTIIGRLCNDPQLRTTREGKQVCSFNVAVNRRVKNQAAAGAHDADFFRVSAWNEQGVSCSRYLSKGRMVGVAGEVSLNTYQGSDGKLRAEMAVMASEVQFIDSPKSAEKPAENGGFTPVDGIDPDLPF